jgi:hypothetical protein
MKNRPAAAGNTGGTEPPRNGWTTSNNCASRRENFSMTTHPDFEELFRLLEENQVKYMIVGGYAVAFHGYPPFHKRYWYFFTLVQNKIRQHLFQHLFPGLTGFSVFLKPVLQKRKRCFSLSFPRRRESRKAARYAVNMPLDSRLRDLPKMYRHRIHGH